MHVSTNNNIMIMKHQQCQFVKSTTAQNTFILNTSGAYTTLGRTNIKHLTPSGYYTYHQV
jgi:hypothetical protein